MPGILSLRPGYAPGLPGQAGNLVGHLASPGFSALTAWPGGTGAKTISNGTNAQSGTGALGDPWVFSYYDFDALTGGTLVTANNVKFVGCRFQSNSQADYNVQTTGTGITFSYCTISPRTALVAVVPNAAWPAAGLGLNIAESVSGYGNYQIAGDLGYQYGINATAGGPVTIDHCDIWGFGNSIVFYSTTSQMTVTNNWIHDAANSNVNSYHTDGPGYLNGTTPTTHVSIQGNVIASIGNTNGIAFQNATAPYDSISVVGNYISGFGLAVDICHNVANSTNLTFTDNILATDIAWVFGPIYTDFAAMFTQSGHPTNLWRRNTLKVYPGTSPVAGSTFTFNSGDNNKYILPDKSLSAADWTL